MKNLMLLGVGLLMSLQNYAQEMEGVWYGWIEAGGSVLPLEVHCESEQKGPYTLYSKTQSIQPIAIDGWKFKKGVWNWKSSRINASYQGEWNSKEEKFIGFFTQGGVRFELQFSKEKKDGDLQAQNLQMTNRPQTPFPPFNYPTEELVIKVKDGNGEELQLAGTLSLPNGAGPFPCLLLITGSGPQDRDETILGHKPFAVLADTLAKLGWATFRYDERGVAASTGHFSNATSADFAADASAIFSHLLGHPKLNPKQMGLLGHSEGSMVAAMVASSNPNVHCIVSMAGPGVRGLELLQRQVMDIQISNGKKRADAQQDVDFNTRIMDFIIQTDDSIKVADFIAQNVVNPLQTPASKEDAKLEGEEIFDYYNQSFNTRWMRYFIRLSPSEFWNKVNCPVLILNGDSDLQVNATVNANAIYAALPHHSQHLLMVLSNHNHLFQYSETGKISEYGVITESISVETIEAIAEWLKKLP
jgi:uncharacterized protein